MATDDGSEKIISLPRDTFKKKNYRPWNFMDDFATPSNTESVSKPLAEPLATNTESVSKPLATSDQIPQSVSKQKIKALAKREQSVSKALANTELSTPIILTGKEKDLAQFIYEHCKNIGAFETNEITSEELIEYLNISANRLRNLVIRLTKKKIISVINLKNGRSSWRQFSLSKNVFNQFAFNDSVSKALAKREQSVSKALAEPLAEPLAAAYSSSNILNNITTTIELSEDWKQVNFDTLRHIGFSESHVKQLSSLTTPEKLQASINAFAFGLQNNGLAKDYEKSALNTLIGVLRKGNDWVEPAYKSPEELLEEKLQKARESKLSQEKALIERKKQFEQELIDIALEEWMLSHSNKEHSELANRSNLSPGIGLKQRLRNAFVHFIWSEVSEKYLSKFSE